MGGTVDVAPKGAFEIRAYLRCDEYFVPMGLQSELPLISLLRPNGNSQTKSGAQPDELLGLA